MNFERVLIDGDVFIWRLGYSEDIYDLSDCYESLTAFFNHYSSLFNDAPYTVFLSSDDETVNHRYRIATTYGYKANRKDKEKPPGYHQIKELLIQEFPSHVATFGEADDELGYAQTDTSVIISPDKDLLMVPGYLYRPKEQQLLHITNPGELIFEPQRSQLKGTGFLWFCAQLIMGDMIDNIYGIPRYGAVKTYKYLSSCKSEEDAWTKVCELYKQKSMFPERLIENAQLLWIFQKPFIRPTLNGKDLLSELRESIN